MDAESSRHRNSSQDRACATVENATLKLLESEVGPARCQHWKPGRVSEVCRGRLREALHPHFHKFPKLSWQIRTERSGRLYRAMDVAVDDVLSQTQALS